MVLKLLSRLFVPFGVWKQNLAVMWVSSILGFGCTSWLIRWFGTLNIAE